jgi:hypothetical protein
MVAVSISSTIWDFTPDDLRGDRSGLKRYKYIYIYKWLAPWAVDKVMVPWQTAMTSLQWPLFGGMEENV